MKFKVLFLLLLPVLGFSQTALLRDMTGIVALHEQNKKNIRASLSYEGSKNVVVVFNNDTIRGSFELKNGYLLKENQSIDLYDKQLTYLHFDEDDGDYVILKRLSDFDNRLHRLLIESDKFTVYAKSVNAHSRKFLLAYNNTVYRLKRSILRSREANLRKSLDKIPLNVLDKETAYKKVLELYYNKEV